MDEFTPLIAGVFALSGVVLGATLGRASEHRKWLREERMKAYQQYLELFGVAQLRNFLDILGHQGQAQDVELSDSLALFEKLHNASVRVMVVAPAEIATEVSETLERMFELKGWADDLPKVLGEKHYSKGMTRAQREDASERVRQEAVEQMADRLEKFLDQSMDRLENIANLIRGNLRVGT